MKKWAAIAAVVVITASGAACSSPPGTDPMAETIPTSTPDFPATDMPTAPDISGRLQQAVQGAADRGAELSFAFLDRTTGTYVGSADTEPIETASVVKLFIADDVLFRESTGDVTLDQQDRDYLRPMLESSDDSAAQVLWDEFGGSDIVTRVSGRYGLVATTPPYDGSWWNTETTTADIVTYYAKLLDGTGGLAPDREKTITDFLALSTPEGADGYPQTFGIPRALAGEPVRGVKQGWMCCVADRWIHLSTGFVGENERYVIAVGSRETPWYGADGGSTQTTPDTSVEDDDGAKHARLTVTGALKILFPDGRIDS